MSVPERCRRLLDEETGLLDLDDAFRRAGSDLLNSLGNPPGELEQRLCMRSGFPFQHRRSAFVPGLANFWIELNAAKEIHSELFRCLLCPAAREDVYLVMAVRAHEIAHVLDHAGDVDFHLAEHFYGFAGILQRNIRRRGDYNCGG